jgi:ribosome biogenesis protein ERB1
MPISARPLPKSKFLPSKYELARVRSIVKAMREGTYKTLEERDKEKQNKLNPNPKFYMIWNDNEEDILNDSNRNKFHLPAPKMPLPGHAESYNPPPEYLLGMLESYLKLLR